MEMVDEFHWKMAARQLPDDYHFCLDEKALQWLGRLNPVATMLFYEQLAKRG